MGDSGTVASNNEDPVANMLKSFEAEDEIDSSKPLQIPSEMSERTTQVCKHRADENPKLAVKKAQMPTKYKIGETIGGFPISKAYPSAAVHESKQIYSYNSDQNSSLPQAKTNLIASASAPSTSASIPDDPERLHADRTRIYEEIRKIVIRRIPEDKKGNYTERDIYKQAMNFEALLFKFKLSYDYYLDLSTLEKRILILVRMTLFPNKNVLTKMPKLIVDIDKTGMKN